MDLESFKAKYQIISKDDKVLENFFSELSKKEQILQVFEALSQLGSFDPSKNPPAKKIMNQDGTVSLTAPMWNVQPYLLAVAKRMQDNPDDVVYSKLRKIADDIITFKQFGEDELRNYRTDSIIIKIIFSLPKKFIRESDIDFIEHLLNDQVYPTMYLSMDIPDVVIPKLIEDDNRELLLKTLKISTMPHRNKDLRGFHLVVKDYDFKRITHGYSQAIALKLGIKSAQIVIDSIETRINERDQKFDIWSVRTIEDHEQTNKYNESDDFMLVKLVREILTHCNCDQEFKSLIKSLLTKEHHYDIWKRLAFYIINTRFNELQDLFWSITNPIEFVYCRHELYELFKNHSCEFNDQVINRIVNWINSANFRIFGEDEKTQEMSLAYRRKEWLTSLLESGSQLVMDEYERQNQINNAEIKHPGFLVYMEMTSGHRHPILIEDFLKKNTQERVSYLNSFDDSKRSFEDGDKEGLAYTLRAAIVRDPSSFIRDLHCYKDIDYVYLWGLVEGFRDIENIFDYDFDALLTFLLTTIQDTRFKQALKQEVKSINYACWYFSSINYYFEKILNQNNAKFLEEKFDVIESILLALGRLANPVNQKYQKDIINIVLNSHMGKVLENLIETLGPLRFGLNQAPWSETTKLFFKELLTSEQFIEAHVTFGRFFHVVDKLDQNLLTEEFDHIFSFEIEYLWKSAMTGFLFGHWRSSGQWYDLFKQKGHYKKAIDTEFEDNFANQMIARHICEGYLADYENIDDQNSLMRYLLAKRKPDHILELTKYSADKLVDARLKDKLYLLLDKIYIILERHEEEVQLNLSRSLLFECLEFIHKIDDQVLKWVLYSAKHIRQLDAYQMIDHLLKLVNDNPNEVAMIFIATVQAGNHPGGSSEFYRDKVSELMKILIDKGYKEEIKQIAKEYFVQGYVFVKSIVDES